MDATDHDVTGGSVAIVRDGRVLVQLRPFPPGWELPGGHVDSGEDPALAAAREAEEECGLRVRILGLVGVYSWSGLRHSADAVYLGAVEGGHERRSLEAWATRWVGPDQLPRAVFPWIRQRVVDALAASTGAPPVHRTQHIGAYHVAAFGGVWMSAPLDLLHRLRHQRRR
ncbi:MAG: NUDIX domain-containing protein [Candidatus Dormibacteria bacterium]